MLRTFSASLAIGAAVCLAARLSYDFSGGRVLKGIGIAVYLAAMGAVNVMMMATFSSMLTTERRSR